MRLGAADALRAGMMHYRMGSDSAPDRIDAIRGLFADDLDLTEDSGGREMRQYSRTVSPAPLSPDNIDYASTVSTRKARSEASFRGALATNSTTREISSCQVIILTIFAQLLEDAEMSKGSLVRMPGIGSLRSA